MFRNAHKIFHLLALPFALIAVAAHAESLPSKPEDSSVYDENHLLNASEIRNFNSLSQELQEKTGYTIACVLLDDIRPYAIEKNKTNNEAAKDLATLWNQDVLIIVSHKQEAFNIQVSPKASPLISNAALIKLQKNTISTAFTEKKISQGVLFFAWEAARHIAKTQDKVLTINSAAFIPNEDRTSSIMILFIMFVTFLLLMAKFSGRRGVLRNTKKTDEDTGFGGGFGSMQGGFGGGFGRGSAYNRHLYKD